ncbi:MAG: acetylxylan esterase [Saprospiraceae bacterium]|nr:acetylxylan esterase [Saprospiraceae bacterium]
MSPAQYFVWDAIRAIDYLDTRPEVDIDRIGVTGRSGGGTQAAYLMAVDQRIKAAAPECYLTTFKQLLLSGGPQDAEQNPLHFLYKGLDLADLVEARAPKPTLMVTTTRDIFSIQGARDLYIEAQHAYRAHGETDNLSMVEDDAPHQSTRKNREATYRFFQKHLNNPGDPVDVNVEIFPEKELWVTEGGQLSKNGYDQNLFLINKNQTDLILSDSVSRNTPQYLTALPGKLVELTGYEIPTDFSVVFSGTTDYGYYSIEKYLIRTGQNYHIPLIWLRPSQTSGKTILVIDDRGKATHRIVPA